MYGHNLITDIVAFPFFKSEMDDTAHTRLEEGSTRDDVAPISLGCCSTWHGCFCTEIRALETAHSLRMNPRLVHARPSSWFR